MPSVKLRPLAEAPDLQRLTAMHPERYPFLLENTGEASPLGRYDILFAFPGQRLESLPDGRVELDGQPTKEQNYINNYNKIINDSNVVSNIEPTPGLPFTGGWFVYFGYEFAAQVEPVLAATLATPRLPRALMVWIPAGIVHDRVQGSCHAFAVGDHAERMLDAIEADLAALAPGREERTARPDCTIDEEDPALFLASVERIKHYIAAGDVFQVNLSRQWRVDCAGALPPAEAYQRLRETNPAPFAALAWLDAKTAILSSSPERLLESRDGVVRTRPIAGTYPRGTNADDDRRLSAELLLHPKERAEHVMLVDLERNDLGRICRPGTVSVTEMMSLESYAHVHHIVSEVCGELDPRARPGDIVAAVFPGGTITGCPKIRCMEIIAELERGPRDAYTGSLGYIGLDGRLDLNILIRTLSWHDGEYSFRAGAGIVADSDPQRELAETRAKALGMRRVFEADSLDGGAARDQ